VRERYWAVELVQWNEGIEGWSLALLAGVLNENSLPKKPLSQKLTTV
jgi:hypothetical protein